MKLIEILSPKAIVPDLPDCEIEKILKILSQTMLTANPEIQLSPEQLYKALLEREQMGSTTISNGLAIPHCRLSNLPKIIASLGICRKTKTNEENRENPPKIFIALASPENQIAQHLKILARICRIFKNNDLTKMILKKKSPEEIYQAIDQIEKNL